MLSLFLSSVSTFDLAHRTTEIESPLQEPIYKVMMAETPSGAASPE
jgi:hypothetical protein